MISLPFRVVCILIAGFLIVLAVTYIYKLNSRKVFWGVGLTTTIVVTVTTSGEANNKHGQHQSQQAVTLWFVSFKHKF